MGARTRLTNTDTRQILPCQIACRVMDARVLAQMGAAHALEPDAPVAKDRPILRELQASRTVLVKDKVRLQNQLDQQQQRLTRGRLRQVVADIAELDHAIRAQLETCPTRKRALRVIQSVKGIGAVAATTILIVPLGTLLRNALPVSECRRSGG